MNKLIFILAIVIVLFSCSKDDDNGDEINDGTILVKRISFSDDGSNDVNITYKGKKIVKMGPFEGSIYIYYTYEGDLITKIGYSDNENLTATDFNSFIYSNNKLIQIKTLYDNKLFTIEEYSYNSDGMVEINETGNDGIFVYKIYYDAAGNLIKREKFYTTTLTITTNYTYDDKNNHFKNVIGYNVTCSSINNILSTSIKTTFPGSSSLTVETNTYQYDSNDFPTSCSSEKNGKNYITKYYYK